MQKDVVWKCGGLTSPSGMALAAPVIENLSTLQRESNEWWKLAGVVVHEMTHAIDGASRTGDKYYKTNPNFAYATLDEKLKCADYYREVFDRITKASDDTTIFTPRDATQKDNSIDDTMVKYRGDAQNVVKFAWISTLNIHDTLQTWGKKAEDSQIAIAADKKDIRGTAGSWTPSFVTNAKLYIADKDVSDEGKYKFAVNASKLLGLTIHKRAEPISLKRNEITRLDLAIVDNKVNVLANLVGKLSSAILLPADYKASDKLKVDFLIKRALIKLNNDKESPGLLSKNIDKDLRVIRKLSTYTDANGPLENYAKLIAADDNIMGD